MVVGEKPFNSANHCESHRQMRGFMAANSCPRVFFGVFCHTRLDGVNRRYPRRRFGSAG